MPTYSTNKSGEAHVPTFISTVEIEGEIFTGQGAKTKKQAEMSAAKTAYTALKQRMYMHTCLLYVLIYVLFSLACFRHPIN